MARTKLRLAIGYLFYSGRPPFIFTRPRRLSITGDVYAKSKSSAAPNHSTTLIQHTSKGIKYRRIFYFTLPFATGLFGYGYWRSIRRNNGQFATSFEVRCYCALPLRTLSRWWGWMADIEVPTFLRPWIYGAYVNTFGVNLDEAKVSDLKAYATLSDFFCRELREDVRQIDKNSLLVSPCDGIVLHYGPADSGIVEQVKGVNYDLRQFLGDTTWCQKDKAGNSPDQVLLQNKNNKLYQCTIYLAPGDYHRFHSPADWRAVQRQHFSGELLSVNPGIVSWIPNLFTLNERVSYTGVWHQGFFSMTAVGATNVGKIRVYFDDLLNTNIRKSRTCSCNQLRLDEPQKLRKGEMFGEFRMGSTIVLIFEARPDFQFSVQSRSRIRMGESLGRVASKGFIQSISSKIPEIRIR